MTFFPIVERELRQASRQRSIYRARLVVSGLAVLLATLLLLTLAWGSARFAGATFFHALFFIAFFYCVWEGGRNTADCVSEEKRAGTLGLLFLTNLRGADIVLGKLTAASTRAFHGFLGFFPVLAMSLVLGGITAGEFWRAVIVLMNTFAFGLALGLLISSLVRSGGVALAATFGSLAAANLLPIFLSSFLKTYVWLVVWSPGLGANLLWEANYQTRKTVFWASQFLAPASSLLFLWIASALIGRSLQDKEMPMNHYSGHRRLPGSIAQRQLLETNPVCWLATYQTRFRSRFLYCALGGMLLLVFNLILPPIFGGIGGVAILVLGLKLWVAYEASFQLAEARRSGALELIAATPLVSGEMARGYRLGLIYLFRWPVLALVVCYLILSSISKLSVMGSRQWQEMLFALQSLFWTTQLLLDLFAVGFVGLWCGLTGSKPVTAFGKTILITMILPAILVCIPNIIIDLVLISVFRPKLDQFRDLVVGVMRPPPGLVPWPSNMGRGAPPS